MVAQTWRIVNIYVLPAFKTAKKFTFVFRTCIIKLRKGEGVIYAGKLCFSGAIVQGNAD